MDRVVSQLLAEVDGVQAGASGADLFVIGATNRSVHQPFCHEASCSLLTCPLHIIRVAWEATLTLQKGTI